MEFTNEITLAVPTDEVFAALTDVERVASCLPGARVEGRDGDGYRGAMRVKVGPIVADYRGSLRFDELDREARRAVLLASGEETAGQGSAKARIISYVLDDVAGARVVVETDLQVRGRVAQFGSGAMEKIAKRMFADFARNLEKLIADGEQAPNGTSPEGSSSNAAPRVSPVAGGAPQSAVSEATHDEQDDSLDVFGLIGEPVIGWLRRSGTPIAVALAIGYLFGRLRSMSA